MKKKIVDAAHLEQKTQIEKVINGMTFTKNFRSATAEEWYVFLPGYEDPRTGGAAGKAMIHYNLCGNRDVFTRSP